MTNYRNLNSVVLDILNNTLYMVLYKTLLHLTVPGLNKVAKKLNMDCVPAMVGWDSHCGFSHPVWVQLNVILLEWSEFVVA